MSGSSPKKLATQRPVATASPRGVQPAAPSSRSRLTRRAASKLLNLRQAVGLTQAEIAQRIGISKRSYGAFERGEVSMLALEALVELEAELASRVPVRPVPVLRIAAAPSRKKAA